MENTLFPSTLFCDNHNNMSMDIKSDYISPLCRVIEVKTQAVLCQSGGTEDYGNNPNPNWFGSN